MNEELLKRLDVLAAKLNTSAQFLWSVLIKQAKVEMIEDALFIALTAVGLWIVIKWTQSFYKRHDELTDCPAEGIPLVFCWIFGVIAMPFSIYALFEIPTLLFNPQFWALQQIVSQLK